MGGHFYTIGEYIDEYMRLCDEAKKQFGYRNECDPTISMGKEDRL